MERPHRENRRQHSGDEKVAEWRVTVDVSRLRGRGREGGREGCDSAAETAVQAARVG